MRDRPTGPELLAIAEQTEATGRYVELMIANARRIAARQADFGDAPEAQELDSLAALLGGSAAGHGGDVHAALVRLYGDLRNDIRAGRLDPGSPDGQAAYRHLMEAVEQKVRESNPKALGDT